MEAAPGEGVAGEVPEREKVFQEVFDKYKGNEYNFKVLSQPRASSDEGGSVSDLIVHGAEEEPLTIDDVLHTACRPMTSVKNVRVFFDKQGPLPNSWNDDEVLAAVKAQDFDQLPDILRPAQKLPLYTKMSILIAENADGSKTVLKKFTVESEQPLAVARAVHILKGDGHVPVFRPGPWGVKKATQVLLERAKGHFVFWEQVEQPSAKKKGKLDAAEGWQPTEKELEKGIKLIEKGDEGYEACPETGGNEQLLWVLKATRVKNAPLKGWPSNVVKQAADNKAKNMHCADVEYWFPLLTSDFQDILQTPILRVVIPLLPTHGPFVLGFSGLGKTPFVTALAMGKSRYNVRKAGLSKKPGWRTGKHLEVFRNKCGNVEIADLLDDPCLPAMSIQEAMVFLNSGQTNCATSVRYNPAKFKKSSCRALLSNEIEEDEEPDDDDRITITWDEFKKFVGKGFGYVKPPLFMAFLKRCIVIVGGKNGFYIRLPSESEHQPIYRFKDACLRQNGDWLKADHKEQYAAYMNNIQEEYDGYAAAMQKENDLFDHLLSKYEKTPLEEIIEDGNRILKTYLETPVIHMEPVFHHVLATPTSPGTPPLRIPAGADGSYSDLSLYLAPQSTVRRWDRRSRFRSPAPAGSAATDAASVDEALQRARTLSLQSAAAIGTGVESLAGSANDHLNSTQHRPFCGTNEDKLEIEKILCNLAKEHHGSTIDLLDRPPKRFCGDGAADELEIQKILWESAKNIHGTTVDLEAEEQMDIERELEDFIEAGALAEQALCISTTVEHMLSTLMV